MLEEKRSTRHTYTPSLGFLLATVAVILEGAADKNPGEQMQPQAPTLSPTFWKMARNLWNRAGETNAFGRAAELAFYFLLAFFPLLIVVFNIFGFLPGLQNHVLNLLGDFIPDEAMTLVNGWTLDVVGNRSGKLLTFALLGAIWAASSGVAALVRAINAAYNLRDDRSFWKTRLLAIVLTVGLSLALGASEMLIVSGDWLLSRMSRSWELFGRLSTVWRNVNFLLGAAILLAAVEALYHMAPIEKRRRAWISPGSLFATAAFIIGSSGFSLYVRIASSYSVTYGSLGAVIVLMLWLYMFGLVLFFGALINAEIGATSAERTEGQRSESIQVT
jgi:membrane protein